MYPPAITTQLKNRPGSRYRTLFQKVELEYNSGLSRQSIGLPNAEFQ